MKIEIDINERTIIEALLDEVNTEYIQKVTDSRIENTDFSEYLDIDTDDIRYEIEDDILYQVGDYLDYDDIRERIEDDIIDNMWSGFSITDHIDFNDIKNDCGVYELEESVEALVETVAQLELVLSQNPPRKTGLVRRVLGWLWQNE